jgi:hypothetical protein
MLAPSLAKRFISLVLARALGSGSHHCSACPSLALSSRIEKISLGQETVKGGISTSWKELTGASIKELSSKEY